MPYKHKQSSEKPKAKYRVRNWKEYNEALKNRGSLTFWFSDDAIQAWHSPPSGNRGGQEKYSDLAIETAMTLRLVYDLKFRQLEGFVASLVALMSLPIEIPNYSTVSRRAANMNVSKHLPKATEPVHVIVDSSGLKVFGAGEWQRCKYGLRRRRSWRKLHLAIDGEGNILASELTTKEAGDESQVPNLLHQISSPIGSFIADGCYDGKPVYEAVAVHADDIPIHVIIPPRKNAVESGTTGGVMVQRDEHIRFIDRHGRWAWEKCTGYGRRSLVENSFYRYKTIIGPKLRARELATQQTEANVACNCLNRMAALGMPESYRVA